MISKMIFKRKKSLGWTDTSNIPDTGTKYVSTISFDDFEQTLRTGRLPGQGWRLQPNEVVKRFVVSNYGVTVHVARKS